MRVPKGETFGLKPSYYIDQNDSSQAAVLVLGSCGRIPLSPLFREVCDSHFEPLVKSLCSKEEYDILENMCTGEDFNVKQHVESQRDSVVAAKRGSGWPPATLGSSLIGALLPSMCKSPKTNAA